jgi:uncharacterized protein YdhG (YjbR/CyaY superfamily)
MEITANALAVLVISWPPRPGGPTCPSKQTRRQGSASRRVERDGCAHNVRSMSAKRSRKRVASVREYVESKPKECRASLEAVRRAILKALPNAQEGLAYQMPAYALNGIGVLYFAGWKSHYSLYPASDALFEAFAKELSPYERSKGTLKFPLSEAVPVRLIERIAKFRARQVTMREARRIIASKRKRRANAGSGGPEIETS